MVGVVALVIAPYLSHSHQGRHRACNFKCGTEHSAEQGSVGRATLGCVEDFGQAQQELMELCHSRYALKQRSLGQLKIEACRS